jgi:uncharacterized protein with NRDE domain
MCLIFFSLHTHPRYRVAVAANRDEFYQRPTEPMHFWADNQILAGRDVQAEGTWLGLSRHGQWAFVTNYRDPANIRPDAPSRGKLVSDFLQSNATPAAFFQSLAPQANAYNGFNLVAGTPNEAWYFSNYGPAPGPVGPGYYGLSNALLETPWPKLVNGKKKLAHVLTANPIEPAAVFQALYDEERAKDGDLPDTGIGLERERALSSMFIKTPVYGTRCSTVLLIDYKNRATVVERTYDLQTFSFIDRSFELQLTP